MTHHDPEPSGSLLPHSLLAERLARLDFPPREVTESDPLYAMSSSMMTLTKELDATLHELDRARRLATKLEEVVAMRTAVLESLIEWFDRDGWLHDQRSLTLNSLMAWAKAQLGEVP